MSNPYGTPPPFPKQPVPAPYQQVPTGPRGLATASIWLAIALTAVVVITAGVSYPVSMAVNDTMMSATPSTSTWIWISTSIALGFALIAVLLSLYIVGCLWLLRSYDFAKVINPTFHMRRSRAWVWLGWWVPIVSLWFPLQVVDDVRRATAKNQARSSLAIWWTAWLVAIFATNLSGRIFNSDDVLSRDAIIIVAMIDALSAVALVIACVNWISIIQGITRDQEMARG